MIDQLEPRRMLSAGDLDLSFGNKGQVSFDLSNETNHTLAMPAANGQVVLFNGAFDYYTLLRLNKDGSQDKTFGNDGRVRADASLEKMATTSPLDGTIAVLADNQVTFYTADGQLKFGSSSSITLPDFYADESPSICFQPDGKLLVGTSYARSDTAAVVYRIDTSGSLDPTFGNNGEVVLEDLRFINAIAVSQTNPSKIILGGWFGDGSNNVLSEVRLNIDGSYDTSFATNGNRQGYPARPFRDISGVAVRPDGSIVFLVRDEGSGELLFISADGTTEKSIPLSDQRYGAVTQLAMQSDGKLLVSATRLSLSTNDWLARFNADGTPDLRFGTQGVQEFEGHVDGMTLALAPDGDAILAESIYQSNTEDPPNQIDVNILKVETDNGRLRAPAGTTVLDSAVSALDVAGTDAADRISLTRHGNEIFVSVNDSVTRFSATKVAQIFVHSGPGEDLVSIGANVGGTYVLGGDGNDTLRGGEGNDTLTGGGGRDLIFGGAGNDRLNGNGGNDTLSGDSGNDRVYGGNGNDSLYGGSGPDRLYGEAGDDYLKGDGGADRLDGGDGTNHATADEGDVLIGILLP